MANFFKEKVRLAWYILPRQVTRKHEKRNLLCVIVPRGVLLGIIGGSVPPGSPTPDPVSEPNKCHFSHPFSELAFKKLCNHDLN